jgi:hypothetical protein
MALSTFPPRTGTDTIPLCCCTVPNDPQVDGKLREAAVNKPRKAPSVTPHILA